MPKHAKPSGGRGELILAATAGVLFLAPVAGDRAADPPAEASIPAGDADSIDSIVLPEDATTESAGTSGPGRGSGRGDAVDKVAADPVRMRVPAIDVQTHVTDLEIDGQDELRAPRRFDRAGWNKSGPEPGEAGAAVIAGHVDSRSGPAVFYRLRDLDSGDRIHVDRADDSTVTFTVRKVSRFSKKRFPDKVYEPTPDAQLRLITCGGTFDQSRRSYRDNIVVFAERAPER